MFLTTTSTILEGAIETTITTTQPVFFVSYADVTSSALAPGSQLGSFNSATRVTLCSAPAASTTRQIRNVQIYNADSVSHDFTINHYDGTTRRTLAKLTVAAGATLQWSSDRGWCKPDGTPFTLLSSDIVDFTEAAQDAVGGSLTDTADIVFTYDDAANTISAEIDASTWTLLT